MQNKYHKENFDRISEEKQSYIIDIAIQEFANKGFNNSNINIIAEKAGISVGSLYKYFETKENLFLAAIQFGVNELDNALNKISDTGSDFFEKVEEILKTVQVHARKHPNLHRLYNEMSSEGNAELVRVISDNLESVSSLKYQQLIAMAKKEGILAANVDEKIFSWCLDNIFVALQFSYSCDYYKERFQIYLGEDILNQDQYVIDQIMSFIRNAFQKR